MDTHTHTPGAVHTHLEQWTHRHTHTHTHTHTPGAVDTHLEQWTHTHTHTWSSGHTHTPGAVDTHTHTLSSGHTHTHLEQWTHTHTWSRGQSGSSRGFGALLKSLTSVVDNSCRSRDLNPQPRVTSPTLYPLEPRLPLSYLQIVFF